MMKREAALAIGDVPFFVRGTLLHPPPDAPDPDYAAFERIPAPGETAGCSITVQFSYDEGPGLWRKKRLFDGGDSWTVHQDDTGYIISHHPPSLSRPIWVAAANRNFSDISVYIRYKNSPRAKKQAVFYPLRYPLDQILLLHFLGLRDGFIIHAAGGLFGGRLFVFPGKSGAGKSTMASCMDGVHHCRLLSDDRMIIRIGKNNTVYGYGTPWPGEAGIAENMKGVLSGLCFLHKAPENRLSPITPRQAFEQLIPVTSIPWYNQTIVDTLFRIFEQIVRSVPAYNLFFTPRPDIGAYLEQALG